MRFMMKVELPVEVANDMSADGKLGSTIKQILEQLEPEAAYFTTSGGDRAGLIFFELEDASEIPKVAEPWFHAFEASVEIVPVMVPGDLEKAAPDIKRAAKMYG
ncbi:MAG: hypothetical protein HOC91_02705 [Nitrospinaceae bacterium]|jgi:hypothetical protein|nr:hypothetical protein [Nitrospinaceae bacterium]MBT3434515.1 hypothetical protein [Nitrospinaceae bacterium]MBT3819839.1 hypothetical protein [Nitrospinaceae bacterium]MBT4095494.1 hypothetical protein [Nitrospinaceae bacterium]MBT4429404.1 hypothetical protein [Nitrospinaceae bacterium]